MIFDSKITNHKPHFNLNTRILITGATIVNENELFTGSVLIEEGLIAGVYRKDDQPDTEDWEDIVLIDGRGLHLFPGVIDDQVHFREPGLTRKGDIASESRAAVAGGTTSFMDMPNTDPKAITLALLEEKFAIASRSSMANFSFFLGATNENIDEIRKADPRRICGLKVFLGASTGNMLVNDQNALERIFRESPLLVAIHSEDETIIRQNLERFREKYGEAIPVEAHPLIRSDEACYVSTERAVQLARKHGTRLHVLHLSTAKELELLESGIAIEDKKITAEVCIHHLWFSDQDYRHKGSLIKWNPAIKTASDRDALLAGLLSGKVDIIATDHAPHLHEEKSNPYINCPSGAPLVQHSLVAMLELHHRKKISLEAITEKMAHAPARLYRIDRRGFIRKGFYADLVLVDLNAPWKVSPENILYKCGWSPFEGETFRSSIRYTFVNGIPVFASGKIASAPAGRRLTFNVNKVPKS